MSSHYDKHSITLLFQIQTESDNQQTKCGYFAALETNFARAL